MKIKVLTLILPVFLLSSGYGFASAEEALPPHVKALIKQKNIAELERETEKLNKAGSPFLENLARGEAFLLQGDPDKAEGAFRKALELNPAGMEGKIGLAKVRAAKKEPERARDILTEALRTSPHPVRLYYELGLILEAAGDGKAAAEAFEKGLERHFTKK